ncbi:class I SAM-dependent methyltransferase [Roseibium sp. LAB1]
MEQTTKPDHPFSQPVSHATTTGMSGRGFYNANSATQWTAIETILPLIEEAIATLPADGTGPIGIADYGCSEGRNSIAVMKQALPALLARTERPIQTLHSDLPTNDFSELFRGLRPDGGSVFGSDRIYSAAIGGSMYDQLCPPQTLHLATTFNAIGFLSCRPVDRLPGYILPNGPSAARANGYVAEEDRHAFAEQAKQDIARYLVVRAKELVPGGKLLVEVFGSKGPARTCDGLYDLLNDAVLDFVEAGDIGRDVYDRYYQPVYMRELKELTDPVTNEAYGAAGLYSIDRTMEYEIAVPFVDRFKKDGDLDRYASDYVNFFRAFTEAVLRAALPDSSSREDLINRIFARAEDRLKADTSLYPFRYAAVAMLLTRNG